MSFYTIRDVQRVRDVTNAVHSGTRPCYQKTIPSDRVCGIIGSLRCSEPMYVQPICVCQIQEGGD